MIMTWPCLHFSGAGSGQYELLPAEGGGPHEDEPGQEEDDGAEQGQVDTIQLNYASSTD